MKFGNMGNMGNILKQAQKMQSDMKKVQEELVNERIEGSAGGGMVVATVNGQSELMSIKISPDVVDPKDVEMLEDLVLAAISDATHKAQENMQQKMGQVTGGLGGALGGMGLPF